MPSLVHHQESDEWKDVIDPLLSNERVVTRQKIAGSLSRFYWHLDNSDDGRIARKSAVQYRTSCR
jgi:hypothetical protein